MDDEHKKRLMHDQERRFWPYYDKKKKERTSEYKIKIDLSSYDGKSNIETFLAWLKNTENFFKYMNTLERKKVHLVALKLKVGASTWWEQVEVNVEE